ncbi:MAG: response regulator [Ruthenibacterium sp.]
MRVLIVDDERLICEWLQFCIEKNPACELVGIANNGQEGLALFHSTQPDLILTDIKMPVMDGLALLRAVRETNQSVQIVLLTAFSDFDLAREALRYGANEYLLKTEMQNEVFQELLHRMCLQCERQHGDDEALQNTSQNHAIIRDVLSCNTDLTPQNLAMLKECGVRWRDNGLFALAVWKQQLMQGGVRFPKEKTARHVAGFDYTDRIYVMVGNFQSTLSEQEKQRQLIHYAKQVQTENHCMVGISTITNRLCAIPGMVQYASYALAQGFYRMETRLYEPQQQPDMLKKQVQNGKTALQTVCLDICRRCIDGDTPELEPFFACVAEYELADVDVLTKMLEALADAFFTQQKENTVTAEQLEALKQSLRDSISIQETTHLMQTFATCCTAAQQLHTKPCSKAISLAGKLMREDFASPLCLEDVASAVYLNAEYFSRIFKEEMGCSFVAYLTELRLQKAMQLLQDTALRVQVIAGEVGYPNVSYFSTTFKKKFGKSPYEYRKKSEL